MRGKQKCRGHGKRIRARKKDMGEGHEREGKRQTWERDTLRGFERKTKV